MRQWFLLLIPFLMTFCTVQEERENRSVFRYNEAANITTLDPAFAKDQSIIWAANQLFDGLVQLDEHLHVIPAIARSWEISPKGIVYVFHLRTDVYFHDNEVFPSGKGRKVTASDFVYSFGRILDPAVASPGFWVFNHLDKTGKEPPVEARDDSTLILRLTRPFPPFTGLLTMKYCAVVPREAVAFYGSDFGRHPVGTGPFRFKMWQEGVKLVLTRNDRYYELEEGHRLPFLDAVAITFIPDRQTAFLDFIRGRLDFMSGIDATYKDELLTPSGTLQPKYNDRIRLITQPYLNTEYLGFMVGNSPLPGKVDKRVRQAINLAFDRGKMIRYLRNNIGTPGINGITPKGLPSFDPSVTFYNYDPGRAAQLLAEAGFPGGRGLPPVSLTSTPEYLDICKYIQHEVAGLGIELKIDVSTPAAMKEMKAGARLPFFRASWIADYPDAENYLSMFYSGNFTPHGPNYTHFSDPRFDRLYEKALTTVSDSIRYTLYREMETIMMTEAPVVILYYDQVFRFVQKNVTGLGINPMNLLSLKRVRKR